MTISMNRVPLHKRSSKRVTITIPFNVYEFLSQKSIEQGRSISNLMAFALESWTCQQMEKE